MGERIKHFDSFWIQTSGTGRSDEGRTMSMTTYMDKGIIHNVPMHFAMMKQLNNSRIAKSAERYFNKITRNNQGNVK